MQQTPTDDPIRARRRQRATGALAAVLLLVAATTPADHVRGQAGGFPVFALFCDDADARASPPMAPYPPAGCEAAEGVRFVVESADAQAIGTCTIGTDGFCRVAAEAEVVIVTEDVTSVPDGYAPRANPVMTWNATEFRGTGFVNVPDVPRPAPAATATLTVHSRFCPDGYGGTDFYGHCHDTPPPYRQTILLSGPEYRASAIDDVGNVVFADVEAGTYRLTQGLPGTIGDLSVFCSHVDAAGNPGDRLTSVTVFSPHGPPGWFETELTLSDGDNVVCDVYALPGAPRGYAFTPTPVVNRLALSVRLLRCPAEYRGSTHRGDCTEPISGATVHFTNADPADYPVVTDESGVAAVEFMYTFIPLNLTLEGHTDTRRDAFFCANEAGHEAQTQVLPDYVAINNWSGDRVTCDWYVVPAR